MQDWQIVQDVMPGLQEARTGEFVQEDILDILHQVPKSQDL